MSARLSMRAYAMDAASKVDWEIIGRKEMELINKARPQYGSVTIKFMGGKICQIKTEIDTDKADIAEVYKN